jgi:hypothetical protein
VCKASIEQQNISVTNILFPAIITAEPEKFVSFKKNMRIFYYKTSQKTPIKSHYHYFGIISQHVS